MVPFSPPWSLQRWKLIFLLFLIVALDATAQRPVRLHGTDYVDAAQFGRRFGLSVKKSTADQLTLNSAWTEIELEKSSIKAELNDLTLFLVSPVVSRSGKLYLSKADAERLFAPILAPHQGPKPPPLRTILIDPGHGGRDPGHTNPRLKLVEKKFTLDVAKRLGHLLEEQGFKTIFTRESDRYVSLEARAAMANRLKPDLLISIHFNGVRSQAVKGAETFVLTPHRDRSTPQRERDGKMARTRYLGNRYDRWNSVVGYQLHRAVVEGTGANDRGLKRFRYSVLRSVRCPAVLVEAGFLSNPAEAKQIASGAYRQRIAEAIARGVVSCREVQRQSAARSREPSDPEST